jgi:hypothetical protein
LPPFHPARPSLAIPFPLTHIRQMYITQSVGTEMRSRRQEYNGRIDLKIHVQAIKMSLESVGRRMKYIHHGDNKRELMRTFKADDRLLFETKPRGYVDLGWMISK